MGSWLDDEAARIAQRRRELVRKAEDDQRARDAQLREDESDRAHRRTQQRYVSEFAAEAVSRGIPLTPLRVAVARLSTHEERRNDSTTRNGGYRKPAPYQYSTAESRTSRGWVLMEFASWDATGRMRPVVGADGYFLTCMAVPDPALPRVPRHFHPGGVYRRTRWTELGEWRPADDQWPPDHAVELTAPDDDGRDMLFGRIGTQRLMVAFLETRRPLTLNEAIQLGEPP